MESLDDSAGAGLAEALGISPVLARLLIKRSVNNPQEARSFLSCGLSSLHDPFLFKDMEKAAARIRSAIENKERVLVYGDYDVDGLTATALLYATLKRYGVHAHNYIPDRVKEGYGLNLEALENARKDGAKLVIAVDCGITAAEEIGFLNKHRIDSIILDHHQPVKGNLPEALAILDPFVPGCRYPYKHLASVGLVYKLMQALGWSREEDLDLVALGTISDVAPLTGENRVLVKHGLKYLAKTQRAGLRALMEVAGIGKKKEFYTETVGFILGPRLNASGRMNSSMHSLKLLLTDDKEEAKKLAEDLDKSNRERQAMEAAILKEAISKVEREVNFKEHRVIVLHGDKWHPGVIGIVASRIVEKFYRPTILVAFNENTGKGSGRSIRNFHLFDALSKCKEHLIEFGGHEHAAGITISKENIDAFRDSLNAVAHEVLQPLDLVPRLEIDAWISLKDITRKFLKELELLEPFGVGNRKPVFAVKGLSLKAKPKILNYNTLKIWVTDGELTYEAVGFKKALDYKLDSASLVFDLAFTPLINVWQGQESIQLQLKDLKFN
ncbi:MAG: single-stranded-DNA-specific exonuclease RecJ [Candidatus Omnitrophica bacterium]|nr:single-stranded-DNA-specific exonuclease RecJ [Candidatus Omnitrophota bacterium]MDD5310482.1 single-stranded-DNA-specific exonuclease RecJ [Candidatus Omnitrophota bacterium]MDD5546674.1 single-stranded-DNA-specific exonuclease RecJ [Candidatus Omnitrophota bacterium]